MAYFDTRQRQIILSEDDKDIFQECALYQNNKDYREKEQKKLLDIFGINLDNLNN